MLYKTGDVVPVSGIYRFVGYTEIPQTFLPRVHERQIQLAVGARFPGSGAQQRAAYWTQTDRY